MAPDRRGIILRRPLEAADVITGLRTQLPFRHTFADHHAQRAQSPPRFTIPNPLQVGQREAVAPLDAAVPLSGLPVETLVVVGLLGQAVQMFLETTLDVLVREGLLVPARQHPV